MRRRDLFKVAGASLTTLAAPRIGRAARTNKLVFVPPIDLSVLDPVVTRLRSTRDHAYLVFDSLYGLDTSWMAQPQMVEGHQVEEDGLTWTLTLRDGLRFHDKEPVLARDVVASIRRFAARISFADAGAAGGDLPFKPIGEVIGSGPFRFLPDEHISGARAAYERFALYQPRGTGAVGFIFPTESRTFRSGRVAGPGSFFGHGGTA